MSASDRKRGEEELILPGFRFHPTDEELVGFYLRRHVENKQLSIELIKQIDIYRYEPWELPGMTSVGADEPEWYFFCQRGRKYRNSVRPNRVTGSGFWKATGIDKPIYSFKAPHNCIGLKKSLVYYRGSAGKGSKTDWMMHEFRLPPKPSRNSTGQAQQNNFSRINNTLQEAEVWTLCRIFKRVTSYKKYIPPHPIPQNLISNNSQGESSSKSCSNESGDKNNKKSEIYVSLADNTLIGKQSNHYLTTQSVSLDNRQTWSDPIGSAGFWNVSGELMFDDCGGSDWDELRHVVDPYDVV